MNKLPRVCIPLLALLVGCSGISDSSHSRKLGAGLWRRTFLGKTEFDRVILRKSDDTIWVKMYHNKYRPIDGQFLPVRVYYKGEWKIEDGLYKETILWTDYPPFQKFVGKLRCYKVLKLTPEELMVVPSENAIPSPDVRIGSESEWGFALAKIVKE